MTQLGSVFSLAGHVCLLAQGEAPNASLLPVLPWIAIGLLFYVLLVRPERKKKQELEQMLQNLKTNDRVVTIGGIFGIVAQVSKDASEVTLKVDENNNTRIRILRSSIARVVRDVPEGA